MLKVGIVGAGKRGTQFLNALSALPICKISFVCDKNEDRLKIIRDKYNSIESCQDYTAAKSKVDTVIIATPPKTHFEIAEFFLKHKVPILLEKPSTLVIEETETLFEIAKSNNTHIQIGYIERYSPPFQEIKRTLLSSDSNNTKFFIEASRCNEFSERIIDIDVILDLMIHDIDIIMNIVKKEPTNFYGFTSSVYSTNYDFAKVMLEFPDNVFAECTANRISAAPDRTMTIYKADSIYKLNFLDQSLTIFSNKSSAIKNDSRLKDLKMKDSNLQSSIDKYINAKVIKSEFKNLIVEQFKEFISFINNPSEYDHSVDILTLKTINKVKEKLLYSGY